MRHAGTQEIETERLVLRRLTPEDAGMMYQNWANDPQVTKFLRWEPHKNADETRELLTAWALLYPNGDYYEWGIVEKATGQLFGTIGIFTSSSAEPERDPCPVSTIPTVCGKWATASAGTGGTKALPPKPSVPL